MHFQEAVQDNPDSPGPRSRLERAMQTSAQSTSARASARGEGSARRRADGVSQGDRNGLHQPARGRRAAAGTHHPRPDRGDASKAAHRYAARTGAAGPPPLLGLRERLRNLNFNNSSVRDILSIIGSSAGIRITYDQAYQDKAYSIELEDVTVEEALQQIMSANQLFYKVINPKTIIVVNDRADKRQQYDDMVVRVFYVSHADAQELSQMVTTVMRVPQMPVAPGDHAEQDGQHDHRPCHDPGGRHHRAHHPLERQAGGSRDRRADPRGQPSARQTAGLNLNAYALGFIFSPEVAPPNTSAPPTCAARRRRSTSTRSARASAPPTSTLTVPTALVRFLETDSRTKTIAKPQLRGAEGTKLTLNLGDDVPVLHRSSAPPHREASRRFRSRPTPTARSA